MAGDKRRSESRNANKQREEEGRGEASGYLCIIGSLNPILLPPPPSFPSGEASKPLYPTKGKREG